MLTRLREKVSKVKFKDACTFIAVLVSIVALCISGGSWLTAEKSLQVAEKALQYQTSVGELSGVWVLPWGRLGGEIYAAPMEVHIENNGDKVIGEVSVSVTTHCAEIALGNETISISPSMPTEADELGDGVHVEVGAVLGPGDNVLLRIPVSLPKEIPGYVGMPEEREKASEWIKKCLQVVASSDVGLSGINVAVELPGLPQWFFPLIFTSD